MGTASDTIVVEDEKEAAFAVQLLNSMIPEWNYRECVDSGNDWDLCGPVGGLEFIATSRYQVLFRHQGTGRVYGIVAPDYDVYAPRSYKRVLLEPDLVKRVDRYGSSCTSESSSRALD